MKPIKNLQELQDILEKPKLYKLYTDHVGTKIHMSFAQLLKKQLQEILANIAIKKYYFETLH